MHQNYLFVALTCCALFPLLTSAQTLVPDDDVEGMSIAEGYDLRLAVDSLDYPSNLTAGDGRVWLTESGYSPDIAPTVRELILPDSGAAGGSGAARIILTPTDLPPGAALPPFTDLTFHEGMIYLSHRQMGANMWPVGAISVFSPDDPVATFETVLTNLPSVGDHSNNTIVFGADGRAYFGQGSATNSGVVGPDNSWVATYPGFREISPIDLVLNGEDFTARVPSGPDPDSNAVTGPFQAFDSGDTAPGTTVPGASAANPVDSMIIGTGTVYSFDPMADDPAATLRLEAWGLRNPFGLTFDANDPTRLFVSNNGTDIRGMAGDPNDPLNPETFVVVGNRPVSNDYDDVFELTVGGDVEFFGWPNTFHDPATKQPLAASDTFFCASPALDSSDCVMPIFDTAFASTLTVQPQFASMGPYVSVTGLEPSSSEAFGFQGDVFATQSGSFSPQTGAFTFTGYKIVRIDSETGEVNDFVVNEGTTSAELLAPAKLNKPVSTVFIDDRMAVVDLGVLEPGINLFEARTGKVWIVEKSTPTAVRELGAAQGLQLGSVTPNPVTDRAQLSFDLDRALELEASVYDLLGRERQVLARGMRQAGEHVLEVHTANLPAGMYVVKFEAAGATTARTFSVTK